MVNVIGVRFENTGKLYFFDPGKLWPTPGDYVIVDTSRGMELAEVVTKMKEIDENSLNTPLRPVIRIATTEDVKHDQENRAGEREAHAICQKKIAEHKLDMKLVRVEFTFDNSKILFYFTSNGRVDFRGLVKDLAGIFKTRIELRQIGVRDEAKMLGGLGPCGRPICCGAFLGDFQPVSIKMAKEQNLSLNPTKISGICGRLMCCLKYEQDQYEAVRKRMPRQGKEVVTPDGPGVVWDLNIIKETVRVRIQKGDSSELRDYPMDDVQRVGQPPRPAKDADKDAATAAETPEAEAAGAEDAAERPEGEAAERPTRREKPQKPRREDAPAQERREKRELRFKHEAAQAEPAEEGERPARGKVRGEVQRKAPPVEPASTDQPVKTADEAAGASQPAAAPVNHQKLEAAVQSKTEAEQKPARPAASWKAALAKAMADATVSDEQ